MIHAPAAAPSANRIASSCGRTWLLSANAPSRTPATPAQPKRTLAIAPTPAASQTAVTEWAT